MVKYIIQLTESNNGWQIDDGFDDLFLATGERHGRSSDARWVGAAGLES